MINYNHIYTSTFKKKSLIFLEYLKLIYFPQQFQVFPNYQESDKNLIQIYNLTHMRHII